MIRKILVGYDGTESSARAFDYAVDLAQRHGAQVEMLGVLNLSAGGGSAVASKVQMEQWQRHFQKQSRMLPGIVLSCRVAAGRPGAEIVARAQAGGFDLIVLGYRHRSGFWRWLAHSTVNTAIGNAHCPVLIVQ